MATSTEDLKQGLIDELAARVRERLPAGRSGLAERFVRRYYSHVPPDDLLSTNTETLYGAALSLWHFAAERPPDGARVRVFNPRPESHGWQLEHTVVEIVAPDMPFLVDSVTGYLMSRDVALHLIVHPVLAVTRDADGRLTDLPESADRATATESMMHLAVSGQPEGDALETLRQGLADVLAEAQAAVRDWGPLTERLDTDIARMAGRDLDEAEAEDRAFLEWLRDDHFLFQGHRTFEITPGSAGEAVAVTPGAGLGILEDPGVRAFAELDTLPDMPAEVVSFVTGPERVLVTKSDRLSVVHRRVPLDLIVVKCFDEAGNVVGLSLHAGLFTAGAYTLSPRAIPRLRRLVGRTLEKAGFSANSHDGKKLLHILETFPRDELFQIGESELFDIAIGILHLQERKRVALFLRYDPFQRFVSCLVYVPRDRYDTPLRHAVHAILERAFAGHIATWYTRVGDSPLARLHFIVRTTPGNVPDVDRHAVESRLAEAARSWDDHLAEALVDHHGEETGLRLYRRYEGGLSAAYREHFGARVAVADLEAVESALAVGSLGLSLYQPLEAAGDALRLKVYRADRPLPLSDILPILENMGLRVESEMPFPVQRADGRAAWIHDFGLRPPEGAGVDPARVRAPFQEALHRVWCGDVEDDSLNRLVLVADLDWREVVVLRAYCRVLRQAGVTFSQAYMADTLAAYPDAARHLITLFRTRHNPDGTGAHDPETERKALEAALAAVPAADADRILRHFQALVEATVRTNFFRTDADGTPRPWLALKIASGDVPALPAPRPWRETFVYSPWVEAVHLRGGPVARGGIRWSDRREDFRTEVLDLMKAQMVKNALIVPVGAKGGFVVKRLPPDGDRHAAGVEAYRTFMRGLLDITDNRDGDRVVPPPRVNRLDGDDPYLVVAPDKGTAAFSDIANEIAADYGFWLGDAFASGGAQGYDHKAMGITAFGAWEGVRRHFLEMGRDPRRDPITVTGVGDMSGDVFGNGLLYAETLKLVAAFDHRHIFVDPDPDPAAGYRERKRLFGTAGATWGDYDSSALSPDGRVFSRDAKHVSLTDGIRRVLGIEAAEVTPNALVRAILKAPVDLLWFGGIGTYVKAAGEAQASVGDRANDAVRVDAEALGCRVIGEGANLGMTQRGRIAFARAGGRLNTDAVDNAGGVACSDHEVNLKVLLDGEVEAGDLTRKQRNDLLRRMRDSVAERVLDAVGGQARAISLVEHEAAGLLDHHARLMRLLERESHLDRRLEALPDEEAVAERQAAGQGLVRPEIATLLAHAKIWLFDRIMETRLPDDPALEGDLLGYFPSVLRRDHETAVRNHRLRRQIAATRATNSLVDRVGGTFVPRLMEATGRNAGDAARAAIIARQAFDLPTIWAELDNLDETVPPATVTAMRCETNRLMERAALWFLRHGSRPLDVGAHVSAYASGVADLDGVIDTVAGPDALAAVEQRAAPWRDAGVPAALAWRVARAILLASACDIVRIAARHDQTVATAADLYFRVGDRFGLGGLRARAETLGAGGDHWRKLAVASVIDDLYGHQRDITDAVLAAHGDRQPEAALTAWLADRATEVGRTDQLLGELGACSHIDLAGLIVAGRQVRMLVGG